MKIAFISSGDPIMDTYPSGGGIQHQIWGLAKELTKKGHETHILSRHMGWDYRSLEGVNIHGIKVALSDPIISRFILSRKMRRKVLEIKPDILYLSDVFTSFFLLRVAIPKLYVTNNTYTDSYKKFAIQSNKLNYLFFDFKQKVEYFVMNNSDIVCALNDSIEKWLNYKGITNTLVLPNSVDPQAYRHEADDKYIFYAGQFLDRKGISYLLDAFDGLSSKFDDYSLVLKGRGKDKKKLIKRASISIKKERIKFFPWTTKEKLTNDYAHCTVFVYPSIYENFGIAIIEAMASGKPVIASNVMGPRDIITHKKDGFLFEMGNTNELKKYLELILSDDKLRNKIGKNARKTVENNYSFQEVSKQLIKILEQ